MDYVTRAKNALSKDRNMPQFVGHILRAGRVFPTSSPAIWRVPWGLPISYRARPICRRTGLARGFADALGIRIFFVRDVRGLQFGQPKR